MNNSNTTTEESKRRRRERRGREVKDIREKKKERWCECVNE